MKKYKTYLPCFSGFDEGMWEFPFGDIEYYLFDYPNKVDKDALQFVLNEVSFHIDYERYEADIVDNIISKLSEIAKQQLPDIVLSIAGSNENDINITCDIKKLKIAFLNHPDSRQYIKENYTSYSGFRSFYENELESWLATFKKDSGHKIGAALELLLDIDIMELYSCGLEDIVIGEYVDFAAILEAVNIEYGSEFKSLDGMQGVKVNNLYDNQFLATLYGIKDKGDVTIHDNRNNLIPYKYAKYLNQGLIVPNLINRKQVKTYIMQKTKDTRTGWDCRQVSKSVLDVLNYKLQHIIDNAVHSHPTLGKTFKEII